MNNYSISDVGYEISCSLQWTWYMP